MADYGEVVMRMVDAFTVVDRADPTIGVAVELLAKADRGYVRTDSDGHLVFCGEVAYRPTRFDLNGLVIVCDRVANWSTEALPYRVQLQPLEGEKQT